MKDIIPIGSHHLFKPKFLNRLAVLEEERERIYREYVADGMRHYEAYQKSIRRLKL